MTKIGQGDHSFRQFSVESYHRQLQMACGRFREALKKFQRSQGTDRVHFKEVMDQELSTLHTAVEELRRAGVHKQEIKVEKDYRLFLQNPSGENLAALEHDLTTLSDYNAL